MEPSSSEKGFFQPSPELPNQFHDDVCFQRALKLFLPPDIRSAAEPELAQLGEDVLSDQIFAWITDAERNKPYLSGAGRDAFGRPRSHLVVGEGWRRLQEFGLRNGFVAAGYDTVSEYGPFARVVQFFRLHLWTASAANVTCPSAMQDGAARLLQLHLARPDLDPARRIAFENAFRRLTSRDPAIAWTSGQWMTERTGGSDVSLTETLARYQPSSEDPSHPGLLAAEDGIPLGPWSISGFKWFSSATDSAMTILLARTPKGISAFFAPMRRRPPHATTSQASPAGSELNGVRIQRLKHKFGTQSLPTAELELDGMRAWLIGQDGRGVNEIASILTLTRIHSAVAAVGYLGRGLGVARAYAKVRVVGAGRGRRLPLSESPLHMRTLAGMTADYHGLLLLTFFTSYVLGLDEHPNAGQTHGRLAALTPPDAKLVAPLLRVLTPLCKAYVCKTAVPLLYACMESLGGLGYMLNEETEYLNVARLFRDGSVLAIWEGTTDVLSTDFVRALKHPRGGRDCLDALDRLITAGWPKDTNEKGTGERSSSWCPLASWQVTKAMIEARSQDELVGDARQIVWSVAEAIIAVLLYSDVQGDGDEAARDILDRFVAQRSGRGSQGYAGTLQRDKAIVYGGVAGTPSRL
ncbi:hypothetical protein ACRALDRAFT_2040333 [Sodiomyces alcalophilus JCM 7366]|uniref:uncharacterized protein n=1 Tax=Sodiomyces alcalophilus JCM 7366 TaxID=591952 RepID=UPI0039B4A182